MTQADFQDLDCEKGLLGYLIANTSAFSIVKSVIESLECFTALAHRNIYAAMLDWDGENGDWDEIGLGNALKSQKKLNDSGGYSYLAELQNQAPGSCNPAYYAKILREHYLARKTLAELDRLKTELLNSDVGLTDAVSDGIEKLQSVQSRLGVRKNRIWSVSEVIPVVFHETEKILETGVSPALSTGIDSLDEVFGGGLFRGKTNIIAGSPSSGKTALVSNIANSASPDLNILMISLETTARSIVRDRLFPINTGVSSTRIRVPGRLDPDDWDRLGDGANLLATYDNFRICDQATMTMSEIESLAASEAKSEDGEGLDLLILDYVQKIKLPEGKGRRWEKFTDICGRLCALIKDLHIYSLIISPINREALKQNRRPRMSDLKECSQFESDADTVGFLYRENKDDDNAVFIMDKNRNGPIGDVPLIFNKKYTRFERA